MKIKLLFLISILFLVGSIGGTVFAQSGFWAPFGTNGALRTTFDIVVQITDDLRFEDEILPDGAICSNGEILKKTGADNWDCAADATGGAGASTTLDVIENSGADSTIEIKSFDWTIDSSGASSTFAIDGGTGIVTIADLSLTATTSIMADLGLTIGTDTQAWDTVLDDLASTTPTKGDIITSDGTDYLDFAVGANSFVLTASSTDSNGLAWQSGGTIPLARIAGSTFSTIQDMQNVFHSAGWISGGGITDDADGTITVAAGTGLIRATDSSTAELLFTDWSAEAGVNVALVDGDTSWVYVEYNSGTPQTIASTTQPTDLNTNFIVGVVAREGTTLHINTEDRYTVGNHASNMITRLQETLSWAQVSGGIISETGTLNIAFTAGDFWRGLTEFTTSAFDSSGADTFTYFHRDGSGGFTSQTGTSAIDELSYDSGSATTTLSNNKYGVHWVYLEVDDDVDVLYGQGDYTLAQAEDAQAPASVPARINTHGFIAGKIIVKKSDTTFTQIESAFQTTFQGSLAQDHGGLAGLSDDDHPQYLLDTDNLSDLNSTSTAIGNLGLTIGADTQAWDIDLGVIAGLEKTAGNLIVGSTTEWTAIGVGTNGWFLSASSTAPGGVAWMASTGSGDLLAANNLSDLSSTSTAIGNLGLTIGADTQAWDDDLDTIAGLSAGTSTLMISSSTAWSTFEVSLCADGNVLTASSSAAVGLDCLAAGAGDLLAANNLSDLSATSTAIGNLGLTLGADTQAWDADLDVFAALDKTSGNLIVATSSAWTVLSTGTDGNFLVASATSATGYDFIAVSGAALFTDSGAFTYLTSTTDDLVIGANATSTAPFWFDVSEEVLTLGTAASGDSTISLSLGGTIVWTFGLDDTDADSFVIANSATLGTTNALAIASSTLDLTLFGDIIAGETLSLDDGTTTISSSELNLLDTMSAKSGADTTFITGTAGSNGHCVQWNVDGDAVTTGAACGGAAASTTLDVIEDVGVDFTTEFKLFDWTIDSAGASSTLVIDGGAGTVTIAGLSLSGSGTVIADLGLTIGADLQAWDDDLDDLAGLTPTKGDIIATAGTNWTDFAVGTNGKVLVASSSAANGLTWSNVTTITDVGTLVAGAISSGFGAINIGASNFTTTGVVNTDTLTLTNTGTLNGLDVLDATSQTTINNIIDGDYLTDGDLDAEVTQRIIVADWAGDGFQASSTVYRDIDNAMLIQEASCYGSDGGSGSVQIEIRSSVTPTVASTTNILSAELTSAGGTVASTTSFANDTADADTVLAFIMTAASSSAAYPDFHHCALFVKVVD